MVGSLAFSLIFVRDEIKISCEVLPEKFVQEDEQIRQFV